MKVSNRQDGEAAKEQETASTQLDDAEESAEDDERVIKKTSGNDTKVDHDDIIRRQHASSSANQHSTEEQGGNLNTNIDCQGNTSSRDNTGAQHEHAHEHRPLQYLAHHGGPYSQQSYWPETAHQPMYSSTDPHAAPAPYYSYYPADHVEHADHHLHIHHVEYIPVPVPIYCIPQYYDYALPPHHQHPQAFSQNSPHCPNIKRRGKMSPRDSIPTNDEAGNSPPSSGTGTSESNCTYTSSISANLNSAESSPISSPRRRRRQRGRRRRAPAVINELHSFETGDDELPGNLIEVFGKMGLPVELFIADSDNEQTQLSTPGASVSDDATLNHLSTPGTSINDDTTMTNMSTPGASVSDFLHQLSMSGASIDDDTF